MAAEDEEYKFSSLDVYAARVFSTKVLGITSTVVILAAVLYRSQNYIEPTDCFTYINRGQWLGNTWYPYQCILMNRPSDSAPCLSKNRQQQQQHNRVTFHGKDSLALYFKWLVDETGEGSYVIPYNIAKSSPLRFNNEQQSLLTEMFWEPNHLDTNILDHYQHLIESTKKGLEVSPSSLIVHQYQSFLTSPTHNPRNTQRDVIRQCKAYLTKLQLLQKQYLEITAQKQSLQPVMVVLISDRDDPKKSANSQCGKFVEKHYEELGRNSSALKSRLVVIHTPSKVLHKTLMEVTGREVQLSFTPPAVMVVMHFLCNSREYGTCCLTTDTSYYTSVVMPLLFVLMASYLGLWLVKLTGANLPLIPYFEIMSIDLDHIYTFIDLSGVIVLAVLTSCLIERLEYFASAGLWSSHILFGLLCVAVVCLGFLKRENCSQNEILNKDQLMEWRGFIVMLLVCIEYTNTEKSSAGFWLHQMLLGCMVFTTGYTHSIYLWTTGDLSLRRVFKVLLRQNYLVLWLSLALNTPYSLYTIPAITTVAFLVVFITMAAWPRLSLESARGSSMFAGKLFVVFSVLTILTLNKSMFSSWHIPPLNILMADEGSPLVAWWSQIVASRYVILLGMIAGYVVLLSSKTNFKIVVYSVKNAFPIIAIICMIIYIGFAATMQRSEDSEQFHSVLVILPILSYVTLRNATESLRGTYSAVFRYCGSMAIEMYVLFQHLMVTHSRKGILALFPGYYSINLLTSLAVWWFMSLSLSTAARTAFTYTKPVTIDEEDEEPPQP